METFLPKNLKTDSRTVSQQLRALADSIEQGDLEVAQLTIGVSKFGVIRRLFLQLVVPPHLHGAAIVPSDERSRIGGAIFHDAEIVPEDAMRLEKKP